MLSNFFCCGASSTNVEPKKDKLEIVGANNWCIVFDQRLQYFFEEADQQIPDYL